jgi:hypothetical protein
MFTMLFGQGEPTSEVANDTSAFGVDVHLSKLLWISPGFNTRRFTGHCHPPAMSARPEADANGATNDQVDSSEAVVCLC